MNKRKVMATLAGIVLAIPIVHGTAGIIAFAAFLFCSGKPSGGCQAGYDLGVVYAVFTWVGAAWAIRAGLLTIKPRPPKPAPEKGPGKWNRPVAAVALGTVSLAFFAYQIREASLTMPPEDFSFALRWGFAALALCGFFVATVWVLLQPEN